MNPEAQALALADDPRLRWCGDRALAIKFGDTIDPAVNRRVLALDRAVAASNLAGVVECVPTYRSLLVHVDPLLVDPVALGENLLRLARSASAAETPGRLWSVPVVYGGEFGIDLEGLAQCHGLGAGEVIERHAAVLYRVYMIGFMPGFTYLGGLDHRLATPRLSEPRPAVPAGSVIIGGAQTGIASVEAPNAWHIIGRTPARMFAARRNPPVLLEAGDEVCFQPIPPERFDVLARAAEAGEPVVELLRP
jgi:KipI family sensor histidine kinase inhibitor